eukprot:1610792-Rhodomonas_salina.1
MDAKMSSELQGTEIHHEISRGTTMSFVGPPRPGRRHRTSFSKRGLLCARRRERWDIWEPVVRATKGTDGTRCPRPLDCKTTSEHRWRNDPFAGWVVKTRANRLSWWSMVTSYDASSRNQNSPRSNLFLQKSRGAKGNVAIKKPVKRNLGKPGLSTQTSCS